MLAPLAVLANCALISERWGGSISVGAGDAIVGLSKTGLSKMS